MRQNLLKKKLQHDQKTSLVMALNSAFKYIDEVLAFNKIILLS